jgi:hypothetical protein
VSTHHSRRPLELRHILQQGKKHPPDLRSCTPSIPSFTTDQIDKTAQLFHTFPLHPHTPFQQGRDTAAGKRANTSGSDGDSTAAFSASQKRKT